MVEPVCDEKHPFDDSEQYEHQLIQRGTHGKTFGAKLLIERNANALIRYCG